QLLDLERRELVAPTLDDVHARAAQDLDVAVRQPARGVAASKPAVWGVGRSRRARIAVVAAEQSRALDPKLAAVAALHVVARAVDDPQLHARQRRTHAARTTLTVQG